MDDALAAMGEGQADALTLGGESLGPFLKRFPGACILPRHFHTVGTVIAVPLGRPAALAFVSAFIERAKADSMVRLALDDAGMLQAAVAPAGWVL